MSETANEEPLLGGRYRIVRQLGEGGMGTVHEAIQEGLGRRVAIKLLHPGRVASDRQRARFRREAETIAQLMHPNLVQVTDFGIDGDRPFMVMEYLEGESLRDYLARAGPLPPSRAVAIAAAVLAALRVVHAAGVVHRDIKPGNVFIVWDDDGQPLPKLLDFGIASDRDRSDSEPDSEPDEDRPTNTVGADAERLTRTDSIFGTIAYMAPEQVRSARLAGPAADQYAVGVVLYQCLSGRLPHEGDSAAMLSLAKLREAPPEISVLCPQLPGPLAASVMRSLAFEIGARFEDVSALRAALLGSVAEAPDAPVATRKTTDSSVDTQQPTMPPTVTEIAEAPSVPTASTAEIGPPAAEAPSDDGEPPPSRRRWLAIAVTGVALAVGAGLFALPDGAATTTELQNTPRQPHKGAEARTLKADASVRATPSRPAVAPIPPAPSEPVSAAPREPAPLPVRPTRPRPPVATASLARRQPVRDRGSYDTWTIAVHLDAATGPVNRCAATGASPIGETVQARLRVDDDGGAHACRATPSTPFGACVCRALGALNWSPPPGGSTELTVEYTLE
ncbi:MAG: protein kinase [Sandaracinaceae bacterium]